MSICSPTNRTIFDGYAKKSAEDSRKTFRQRYLVITYERTVIRNVPNKQRRKSFRDNHNGPEEERLVLKYYDGERETEREEVTKIFTIDDAIITDVRRPFRGYDHLISFRLCERYGGRELLISFEDEEQKKRLLEDIQNYVRERTPSCAETEEFFSKQEPERHQPNEDTNAMRELQNFRHSINLTNEGQETAVHEEDGDFYDDGRFGSFCKNSKNPTDSGYSTTSSRFSVTSRPSTSSRHDLNAHQYKKTAEDILSVVNECEDTHL